MFVELSHLPDTNIKFIEQDNQLYLLTLLKL